MKHLLAAFVLFCLAVNASAHNSNYAENVARDMRGKIARSHSATHEFRKHHPCPATTLTTGACKDYVIDHIKALKHGGADSPLNMQWQTVKDAKAKDRWE